MPDEGAANFTGNFRLWTMIFPAYPLPIAIGTVFQFLIASHKFLLPKKPIILKFKIMKSSNYKNRSEKQNRLNLWDAFTDYLETTYFPGATELLETELIAFEYNAYVEAYS
jgi:hypothetical protein